MGYEIGDEMGDEIGDEMGDQIGNEMGWVMRLIYEQAIVNTFIALIDV